LTPTRIIPVKKYATFRFFFYSPKFVWCAITAGLYAFFRYDTARAASAAAALDVDSSLSEVGSAIQFLLPLKLSVASGEPCRCACIFLVPALSDARRAGFVKSALCKTHYQPKDFFPQYVLNQ
jgi:hypothetical protein